MIIGAMARIGIVCDVMIQGINVFCSVTEFKMPTAMRMPSAVPMTKPSSVEESVTQAWKSSERGEVGLTSTVVFHTSATIWCGAGSTGRSADQVEPIACVTV